MGHAAYARGSKVISMQIDREQEERRREKAVRFEHPVTLKHWKHCACRLIDGPHLSGNVYGHPRFPDGEPIHTSAVITVNGYLAVCKSRTYHLVGD